MKIAFTTVLDDKYISGFLITFNSLLRVSPNFNHDLVIFEWGELSDENKDLIRSLYKNVKFKMVNGDLYKNYKYDETFRVWTYNCNYRFDCFTLSEYDKVVFFDCDIIFQLDVDVLLKYDVEFGACQVDVGRIPQIGNRKGFDAGLMIIGKKYLNNNTRDDLLKIANSKPPKEIFLNSDKWMSDEPVINNYFLDKITFIPEKFNFLVPEIKNDDLNNKNNFQFTGHNKPWYGDEKNQQFSEYTLRKLTNTNGQYIRNLMIKKLLKIVKNEIDDLKNKGIDIYKYVGDFYKIDKIGFTTVLDDKHISGFLITLNSLLRSSPKFNYDIVIFEWGDLSDENKNLIRLLYKNVKFKLIEVDLYKNHDYDDTFRKWTYNCNYRFDCFTLCEYDKVVYFDCDIIFQIDVEEILKYGFNFGAIQVPVGTVSQIGKRKGFNAGLMIIGKNFLNKTTRDELIKIANSKPPKEFFIKTDKWISDEPIINTFFLDKITFIPEKFNVLIAEINFNNLNEKNNFHFAGDFKPWEKNKTETRFPEHTIQNLSEINNEHVANIILNRILKIVDGEINDLKNKGIDITKYINKKL